MKTPDYHEIVAAQTVIRKHLPKTPLVRIESISNELGCDYFAKCENLQPVGAFKVRGGVHLLAKLTESEKRAGVISASTGNHGQSIAFAGRIFGVGVIIYSPAVNANPLKIDAMRRLGAEVRLHGRNFDEAREEVERVAQRDGLRYIHSANEPDLIAGVGTIGLEIFDELPDVDVILVPVGAGSGACGIGIVAKFRSKRARVVGVQSERAPAIWHAWRNRNLMSSERMETSHEGLATRVPFELTTGILWDVLDDFLLLSDEQISSAVRQLAERARLVAEGAGAASLAAALAIKEDLKGKRVVGVLSGGNIPLNRLTDILSAPES